MGGPNAGVDFVRSGGDFGLDHAMDRGQVIHVGHSLVVFVFDQQIRKLNLRLVHALAHDRQVEVLRPLCLQIDTDHSELATSRRVKFRQMMLQ